MRPSSSPVVPELPLALRPLESRDAEAWFQYVSDPDVMQHTSSDVQSVETLHSRIEQANTGGPGSPIYFAVCLVPDGRFIGCVGFHSISVADRTAEITCDIHPGYWGMGFATAVCSAAAAWVFADQGYIRIRATVLESNAASFKVLQRCGFRPEGKLHNFREVRGEPRDFLLYSLLRTDPADLK